MERDSLQRPDQRKLDDTPAAATLKARESDRCFTDSGMDIQHRDARSRDRATAMS
jgi:hypothetical protein